MVNGVGDAEGLGWRGRAVATARGAGVDLTAYDLGVRRNTSADVRARWERETLARFPPGAERRLLFAFGTNDCATEEGGGARGPRVAPDDALANADAILARARELAPTVMVGPAPALDDEAVDARVRALEPGLRSVADRHRVPFLPIFEWCRANSAWTEGAARGDGTHPDAAGYAALAGRVLGWAPFRAWVGLG